MRKYIPLVLILLILLVIWGAFSFFVGEQKEEKKTFTNLTELYSESNPHMKEYMNSSLKEINCEAREYYFIDLELCFICNFGDVCFPFNKSRGLNDSEGKLYLTGSPELKNSDYGVDYADFYFDGFASAFNCEKDSIFGSEGLHCDYGVKFVFEEADVVIGDVVMVLEDESGWSGLSSKICKKFKGEQAICEQKDVDEKIEIENTEITFRKFDITHLCLCDDIYIYVKNKRIYYGSGILCK